MKFFYPSIIAFVFIDFLICWALSFDSTAFPEIQPYRNFKLNETYTWEELEAMTPLTEHARKALESAYNITRTHSIPELKAYLKALEEKNRHSAENSHNSSMSKRAFGKGRMDFIPQYAELDNWTEPPGGSFSCWDWADHTMWRWRAHCDHGYDLYCHYANAPPSRATCCRNEFESKADPNILCEDYGGKYPTDNQGIFYKNLVYDSLMCSRDCAMKRPGDCLIWHPNIPGLKMNPEWCLCKIQHCPAWPVGAKCDEFGCGIEWVDK